MTNSYKDLLNLIEIHTNIKESYEESLDKILLFLKYSGCPDIYKTRTSFVDADSIHGSRKELRPDILQNMLNEINRTKQLIEHEDKILKSLCNTKLSVKNKLKGLQGIDYQVAYLKEVEGYNLIQISSKLNKSYDYIREISSRIKKSKEKIKNPQ